MFCYCCYCYIIEKAEPRSQSVPPPNTDTDPIVFRPRPASCANDDPLLHNTIQPIGSFDTNDSNPRPTSMQRQNSRGTFPYVSFTVFRSVVSLRHEVRIYI